ncbi:hypothetical protein Pfo_000702 [Paulownia fortunei]|nr:hypothetical protein Pfo_000702 [Paulownia fortunei]
MKNQSISWLCLIMCAQSIAFIAGQSATSKARGSEVAMDSSIKDMSFNADKPSVEEHTNTGGVEEVVHDRRRSYGGSDLLKKPTKTRSGASDLAVTLGRITFCVCMAVNCFFLLG